ncbi:MAG: hypothetical protein K9I95_03945 [Flavobacteriaceae bacterium]|nr:hypothetical protein [Flavobacteriaceae bacterium]
MKKLLFLLNTSLLLLFSCSSGDDGNNNVQSDFLVGTWEYDAYSAFDPGTALTGTEQLVNYIHLCPTQKNNMVFGEGGSAKNEFNYSDCNQEISLGTYSKNGFILTLDFEPYIDQMDDVWEILSLTNTTLIIAAPNPAPPSDPVEIDVFRFIKIE